MSKVDAQRAMREARYLAQTSLASAARRTAPPQAAGANAADSPAAATSAVDVGSEPAAPARPAKAAARAATKATGSRAKARPTGEVHTTEPDGAAAPDGAEAPGAESICGHRGMGNKACQRPAGHAEKSHRYK